MKIYKITEYWLNVFLILFFAAWILISQNYQLLITSYFVVGGLQLASMVWHAIMKWNTHKGGKRHFYHWSVLVILLFIPLSMGLMLWALFFISPFLAVYYTYICREELQALQHRELVHLKN